MAKATILDRLAGAMETLGKREGKALTPKQRVAATQRWNSLADVGENRLNEYRDTFGRDFLARDRRHAVKNGLDNADYGDELWGLMDLGLVGERGQRPDNPFRLDWMGEPHQYEARLKNYKPLTDAQYERMIEREEEARLRGFEDFPDDFDYMWRY